MKVRAVHICWWLGWRAAVSAVVGAALTVALAYGGAVQDATLDFGGSTPGVRFARDRNTWWDVVHAMASTPDRATLDEVRAVTRWEMELDEADGFTAAVSKEWPAGGEPCDVYMIGWPARCLWGIETQNHSERFGLVDEPLWLESWRAVPWPLPTRVLWGGMAANVAVMGSPLFVLLWVPVAVRRWSRERRGACLGCGYDLGGRREACPECGRVPAGD